MATSSGRTEASTRRLKTLFLSPVVVLFASATRLLLISNYDTTTATTLAASAGVGGTLLGTLVPLLPIFLPAILIFFIIVRRWGLLLLTAVFTALVSPASIHSVKEAGTILINTIDQIKETWRGVLQVQPGLQDAIIDIALVIWDWVDWIFNIILTALLFPLKLLGFDDPSLEPLLRDLWPNFMGLWSNWLWPVRLAVICMVLTLLWALYAPPWNYVPRGLPFSLSRGFLWLPNTVARFLSIAAYGICIAAVCGFSALYLQNVYRVPLAKDMPFDILRRPWLPAEKIQMASGNILVGYTMSIGNGWHVFLDEQHRTIHYLRALEVKDRTVCHLREERPPRPFLSPEHIDSGNIRPCFEQLSELERSMPGRR